MMGSFVLLAAGSLPYDQWWVTWGVLVFLGGPVVTVWAIQLGRQWAWVPIVLAAVLLLAGLWLVDIARECTSWERYGSAPVKCSSGLMEARVGLVFLLPSLRQPAPRSR